MAEDSTSAASALPESEPVVLAPPVGAPVAGPTGTNMVVFGDGSVGNADSVVVIGDGLHADVPFAVCVAPLDWSKVDLSTDNVKRTTDAIVEKIHYHSSSNLVSGKLAVRALADFMAELTQKKNDYDSAVHLASIQASFAAASEASASAL